MPSYETFHLGFHCSQSTCLPVYYMKKDYKYYKLKPKIQGKKTKREYCGNSIKLTPRDDYFVQHNIGLGSKVIKPSQGLHIFMPPKELWEAYSNRTVRPSVSPSVRPSVRPSRFRVRSISPIFFEVGVPNLVCGYILGWRSVAYHFRVTVTLTLTSDLVFRIIVSGVYLLYYLR